MTPDPECRRGAPFPKQQPVRTDNIISRLDSAAKACAHREPTGKINQPASKPGTTALSGWIGSGGFEVMRGKSMLCPNSPESARSTRKFLSGRKHPRGARPLEENQMNKLLVRALAVVVAVGVSGGAYAATDPTDVYPDLHLIPWPKTLELGAGHMQLSTDSRIVAGEEQLKPLAEVLSGEIALLTGLKLKAATGPSRPGDIVLQIDKDGPGGRANPGAAQPRADADDRRRAHHRHRSASGRHGVRLPGDGGRKLDDPAIARHGRTAAFVCPG